MKRLLNFLILSSSLLIAACATSRQAYVAPILPYTLPDSVAGQTVCGWNNLPLIFAQPPILDSRYNNLLNIHEQQHASDMFNYKGGCWAFYYEYRRNVQFRIDAEYRAYCKEGQAALRQNANPFEVWDRIRKALTDLDSNLGAKKPNCIY